MFCFNIIKTGTVYDRHHFKNIIRELPFYIIDIFVYIADTLILRCNSKLSKVIRLIFLTSAITEMHYNTVCFSVTKLRDNRSRWLRIHRRYLLADKCIDKGRLTSRELTHEHDRDRSLRMCNDLVNIFLCF